MPLKETFHKILNWGDSDYVPPEVYNYLEPEEIFSSEREKKVSEAVEKKLEIERFSPEAREALEGYGFRIHELTGRTITDLLENDKLHLNDLYSAVEPNKWGYCDYWFKEFSVLRDTPSKCSEVAIIPDTAFLAGSKGKTLKEQREMVKKYSAILSKHIPAAKVVIGQAPDYVELAHKHKIATQRVDGDGRGEYTGDRILEYGFTRSETAVPDLYDTDHKDGVASVGNDGDEGLGIDFDKYLREDLLYVAPLVVPDNSK